MNKKRIVIIVLVVIALLVALLVAAAPNMLFSFIFGRPSRSTKIPKSYVGTPHYVVSRAGMALMEDMYNEDHYMTSRDGLKLHAYLFPAGGEENTQPKKFVIGVHGYRSYARPECAPYIQFYHDLGYSMLMVDDRAHAPSEGDYIGFGVLDRLDVVDWAKYLVDTYGEDIEILMHGVSMGGATVLSASGEEDLPVQVKGVIGDCGFTSAWDALYYQMKDTMHLPADYLLPKSEKINLERSGFNCHDKSAIEQVKQARVPILFVQGGKDEMVPPFMVDELYDACTSDKRKLFVEEAGHGESIAFAPEQYHQAIIEHFGIEVPDAQ